MKKLPLAILYLGMMIQPIHAESLMERAKKIYNRAIALAKKGGARSKELLKKANFLGNAMKEEDAAKKALKSCQMRYCSKEYQKYLKPIDEGSHVEIISKLKQDIFNYCSRKNCALEMKKVEKAEFGIFASAVAISTIVVVPLAYPVLKAEKERQLHRAE